MTTTLLLGPKWIIRQIWSLHTLHHVARNLLLLLSIGLDPATSTFSF